MILNILAAGLFFAYALISLKKSPVSSYISGLIGFTYLIGLLVGNFPEDFDFRTLVNSVFIIGVLFLFCQAFSGRKITWVTEDHSILTNGFFLSFLSALLLVITVTNLYIVYSSISYVFSDSVNITSFKNEGGAAEMIRTWVDPRLVFLSYGFSPLAYFALALHFYFMLRKRAVLSLVFLFFSFNIPLVGLHALSRSSIVHFILLYFLLYFACYSGIPIFLKRKINIFLMTFFSAIAVVFYFITISRFGDSSFYARADGSLVSNRALYSIFDYGSQWIINGNMALEQFSLTHTWFGKSTFTVVDIIKSMLGLEVREYTAVRQETLGEYSSKFIGLVGTLVYDFSYVGVLYYISIYFLLVKLLTRRGSDVGVRDILIIIIFSSQPLMFFSNNYFGNTMYAIGFFYGMLIYLISKFRVGMRKPCFEELE